LVSLTELIAFWKKKDTPSGPEPKRIIPLPQLPETLSEPPRTTTQEAANKAREALKILKLERQILGSAVTTIYESQTKGIITQADRDQLLEKYKVDVKRLEKAIDENQRVVDLFELESSREDLVKTFRSKLTELDSKIKGLRSGGPTGPITAPKDRKVEQSDQKKEKAPSGEEDKKEHANQKQAANEKKEEDKEISDAEKRVEQIREEILKAMDRLEQIEAEG
jgi:chromosome segregation ATPase